jgi:Tol biopolymer transport system component
LWRARASGGSPDPVEVGYTPVNTLALAGKRLAFSHPLDDIDIWAIRLEAAEGALSREAAAASRLISSTRLENSPQYSPDGGKIAFRSDRSGSAEIYVCNRDGSSVLQLTSFGASFVSYPRWSPDGTRLAFAVNQRGAFEIHAIGAAGGSDRLVHTDPAFEFHVNWSRNGDWIYFASRRSGAPQVWKVPARGGAPVQVTRNRGYAAQESPDGRFVYYLRDYALCRVPVGGGPEIQLLERVDLPFEFVSGGLYSVSREPGSAALDFFSFSGGVARPIAELTPRPMSSIAVSPDGRTVAFGQPERQGTDLMLVDNFR